MLSIPVNPLDHELGAPAFEDTVWTCAAPTTMRQRVLAWPGSFDDEAAVSVLDDPGPETDWLRGPVAAAPVQAAVRCPGSGSASTRIVV